MAFLSFFVDAMLCATLVGTERGYLVGQIGPGLRRLGNIPIYMLFLALAVWPIPAILISGAIGGSVGCAIGRSSDAAERQSGVREMLNG